MSAGNVFFLSKKRYHKSADDVKLINGGEDYFDTLERLIAEARHEIHFQTYIYDNDETGRRITDALINAAKRKVAIYLVVDAYSSKGMGKAMEAELKEAGVKVRRFATLFSGTVGAWGRRLHHKIIVSDRYKALVGGINISNNYSGMGEQPAWLDFAVLVEGNVCKEIYKICTQVYERQFRLSHRRIKAFTDVKKESKNIPVQFCQNDWLRAKNQVARTYMTAIRKAKKEILIMNSYFLPGTRFRLALKNAARRGVRVKIVVPGVSDIPLMHGAAKYLYGFLLRNKIEVYEWQKSVLHAKVACIDGVWSTIGSYNLNYLSAYGSIEFNVNVMNENFGRLFHSRLDQLIAEGCTQVNRQQYADQGPFQRFSLWLSYQLLRLLEALLINFPKQRFFNKNRFA